MKFILATLTLSFGLNALASERWTPPADGSAKKTFRALGRSTSSYENAQADAQRWANQRCPRGAQRVSKWVLDYDARYENGPGCDDLDNRYCAPIVIPEYSASATFSCR